VRPSTSLTGRRRHPDARLATVVFVAIVLAGCVSTVSPAPSRPSAGPCGTVQIAVNPWLGAEADAAVVGFLLQHDLGCTVIKRRLDELTSWQSLESGKIDAILENWGHADLAKTFIESKKVAQDVGPTGTIGVIGWFVPRYVVDANPGLLAASTNPRVLNNYVALFKTEATGAKGQILEGDPRFVTWDRAMINGFGLDYQVVYSGSEAASQQAILAAVAQHEPILAYYVTPNWFSTKVDLVHLALPTFTAGCDRDPNSVACDYPTWHLNKIVSTAFATSGSPAYEFIRRFNWTNADQDLVASYLVDQKTSDDAAAMTWLSANPTKWQAWLP
jgi:glycine betaine/proline transport system substrate-binding protein